LLAATLRPEAGAMAGILAVLSTAMVVRLTLPLLLGSFADDALAGEPTAALTRLASLYVAAALAAALLDLVVVWWSARVSWRVGNRLRERLAAHALRLEQAWHARHSPGQLIERIDGDVEAMAVFFAGMAVQMVGNAVLIAGMLVVALTIEPITALVLGVTAVCGAAVMIRLRLAAVGAREAEREANAQLYGDLEERLGGLEDLRANGAGPYAVHRLHHHSARSWRAARHASLRGDGAYAAAAVVFAVGTAATLAAGVVLQQRGVITVGAVLTLYRYADMQRKPLEQIAEQLKEFQKAMAGARRASTLLATDPAITDGPDDGSALPAGALAVDLDRVTFAYDPGAPPALRAVDLHLAPGTHLGLVGRTGSGKTTVGRLLARVWDVPRDGGRVRLGGVDVRDLTVAALRARVAVVTQDVELFRASVRDNLTLFGTHDPGDERLRAVLDEVGLAAWLASLPRGLDTELRGSEGLSAGEGQLVAFARAFLADPAVVVLDEASSRLDPLTEERIAAATDALLAGRTALVIAHRLDTLDRVDEVAVLDRGRLVEHGRRDELATTPGSRYARLRRAARAADRPDPHHLAPGEAPALAGDRLLDRELSDGALIDRELSDGELVDGELAGEATA
jgi:ABC-type multidrug transport system fused ATPase/permease subunit